MRRTIIIETNGHKDNYVEWDFVLMRPASEQKFEEAVLKMRQQTVHYLWLCGNQQLVDTWNEQYWDKYFLGRIQYVWQTYSWNTVAKIDFIYLAPEWYRGSYAPFGWRYKYFDVERVDIVKCFNYNRDTYMPDIKEFIAKDNWCGIPKTKIVYCKWANTRRADLSNRDINSLTSRIEYRRRERAAREVAATPEEVMARNVYPN